MPAEQGSRDGHPSRAAAYGARLMAWSDGLQRRHAVLGFPYAVVKKYGDDAGGRQAALITYYGFLSIFPLLLVAVSLLTTVLVANSELRAAIVETLVPPPLHDAVDAALTSMPSSGLPLAVGLLGLLFAGTGVVFSAYETLNHVAGVPMRARFGFVSRYARVLLMLVVVLASGVVVATLTVAASARPEEAALQRVYAPGSTYAVVFLVLVGSAKLLVAKPVSLRTTWLAAAAGAFAVTLVLSTGGRLLARLVSNAGPVYGSFATVAGCFALLYLVSQALLYSAEAAVVLHLRLWPRALVTSRPTPADLRALERLASEQERLPGERVELRFEAPRGKGGPP